MEKAVTGYEEKEIDNNLSEIYPSKDVQKVLSKPKFKAFSHVVFLDISSDIIFNRAIEQDVDSMTNIMYHKVLNPPPANELILRNLITIIEKHLNRIKLNKEILQSSLLLQEATEWYSKFLNFTLINANTSIDNIIAMLQPLLLTPTTPLHTEAPKVEIEPKLVEHVEPEPQPQSQPQPISVTPSPVDQVAKLKSKRFYCML